MMLFSARMLPRWACAFGVAWLLSGAPARSAERIAEVEEAMEGKPRISSGQLQLEVMDLSDQYVSAMWAAMDEYIKNEPDASKRVIAQNWKVTFASAAMEIAASNDPRLNVLDMVVFLSAGKWAVNNHWLDVFGPNASRLKKVYADMDKEAWEVADRILTTEQRKALRALIEAWKAENPKSYEVANVRLRNLEGVRLGDFDQASSAKGILASVRRLLGQVDTSLLYGERVMFYLGRTPRILTQQTDLTLSQIAEAFPIAAVRPDLTAVSEVFKGLPQMVQDSIDRNEGLIREIVPEVRKTVESADHLSLTLNDTLKSLKELSDSLQVTLNTIESPVETIKQADAALSHLDSTVMGVNQLLAKDESGESRLSELTKLLDARADRLVDDAFQKALILMAVFFVGVLVVLIVAKILFSRHAPRNGSPSV